MWRKVSLLCLAVSIVLVTSACVRAELLFSDGFEGPGVGDPPDGSKWTYLAGRAGESGDPTWYPDPDFATISVENDVTPPEGTKALKLVSSAGLNNNNVEVSGVVEIRSQVDEDLVQEKNLWIEFSTYFDSDWNADYMILGVLPVGPSGQAVALRFVKPTEISTKYQAEVATSGNTKFAIIKAGLSFSRWEKWVLGVQTTHEGTGKGKYWVYHDDALVTDPNGVEYAPYSGIPVDMANVYMYNYDYNSYPGTETMVRIDDVKIYNRNPLATQCEDAGKVILDGDVNGDCYINIADLSIMIAEWLGCTDPAKNDCDLYWQ